MNEPLSPEVQYTLVLVGLFIVPRVLQRFKIPSAVTCLGLGALFGLALHLFRDDATIRMLGTLGIVTLFLFAGLEVEVSELRRGLRVVLEHIGINLLVLGLAVSVLHQMIYVEMRGTILIALALFTPSTGIILGSLDDFSLEPHHNYWIKAKVIAFELMALVALFLTVQSSNAVSLGLSSVALLGMIALLPVVFRIFEQRILPHAPKSEFTFLVVVAILCALLTRRLGVYYLVGAFVVGVTAVRLRQQIPALSSERLQSAVELFASFFVPFYFFKTGLHLNADDFSFAALGVGLAFLVTIVPIRIILVALHRRLSLKEPLRDGVNVGATMIPTLVFTIVLADILKERYALPPRIYGGLIIYALANTMLPALLLRWLRICTTKREAAAATR